MAAHMIRTVSDTFEKVACRWCRAHNPPESSSCERCGAPLDFRDAVSESGWRMTPRIKGLTTVACGSVRVQFDGRISPAAEVALTAGDSVFFEHHAMLYKDENVAMSVMDTPGGLKRLVDNEPFVLSVAHGPGNVTLSRDAPGRVVCLSLDPGGSFQVRQHAMVVATTGIGYSYEKLPGLRATLAVGAGMYLDSFSAGTAPGLVVLHGYGDVVERTLAPGETVEVEPGSFLYKESTVTVATVTHKLAPQEASSASQAAKGLATRGLAGLRIARTLRKEGIGGIVSGSVLQQAATALSGPGLTLIALKGPGRVGIQSMYSAQVVA